MKTVTVDTMLPSLQNGEPVTMKDAVLRPIESQRKKILLNNISHLEVQLGRLAKLARQMRAEVLSLTPE